MELKGYIVLQKQILPQLQFMNYIIGKKIFGTGIYSYFTQDDIVLKPHQRAIKVSYTLPLEFMNSVVPIMNYQYDGTIPEMKQR